MYRPWLAVGPLCAATGIPNNPSELQFHQNVIRWMHCCQVVLTAFLLRHALSFLSCDAVNGLWFPMQNAAGTAYNALYIFLSVGI
jgi:hypothetical protein